MSNCSYSSIMRRVDKYDGQSIFTGPDVIYTLGNYLGGGASGSVYQASSSISNSSIFQNETFVAIKILHPLGYKLLPIAQIHKCVVLVKESLTPSLDQINGKSPLKIENLWWIYHAESKQYLAAFLVFIYDYI